MSNETARGWYIFNGKGVNGKGVVGPLNSVEVRKLITDGLKPDALIWDGVSLNWKSIVTWNTEHLETSDAWYFSVDGTQTGAITLKELTDKILNKEIPLTAYFWTAGLQKWVTLNDLPPVVEGAGLLRRKVPRVPFVGQVEVRGMNSEAPIGTTTLSEGGIGLHNLLQLGAGAKINLTIVSQLLQDKIDTKAIILHQDEKISSLKFEDLSDQSKEFILNYISKFNSKDELAKTG